MSLQSRNIFPIASAAIVDPPARPAPRARPGGVIAVVGCDGAGKSTLVADLHARLAAERPTELVYLGQGSGRVLDRVVGVPLVGRLVGRYLRRRSARAHADDGRPGSPDRVTALVIHLLSRRRYATFRRVLALHRGGATVITDRYPQAEVPGFYFDGPGLTAGASSSGLVRWLAAREEGLYRRMARDVPALVIRLDIDAATAHARKPDHKLAMLRDKVRVIPTLAFNGAPILALDGRDPYPEVLRAALGAVRAVTSGPVPPPATPVAGWSWPEQDAAGDQLAAAADAAG